MKTITLEEILGKRAIRPKLKINTQRTSTSSSPSKKSSGKSKISIVDHGISKKELESLLNSRNASNKKTYKSYIEYMKNKKVLDKVLI